MAVDRPIAAGTTPRAAGLTALAAGLSVGLTILTYSPDPILAGTTGLAVTLVSAALWVWVWARRPAVAADPVRRAVAIAAGLCAGAAVLSTLAAPLPLQSLIYGVQGTAMGLPVWLALLAVFVIATRMPLGSRTQRALAFGTIAVALAPFSPLLIVGVLKMTNLVISPPIAVVVALIPVALLEARRRAHVAARVGWIVVALLLALVALTTGTASGVGAAVVVLALLPFVMPELLFLRPGRLRLGVQSVVAAVVAAGAGVFALAWVAPSAVPARIAAVAADTIAGGTMQTRFEMWRMAWSVFKDHPLTGAGPDGLLFASQPYLSHKLVQMEGVGFFGMNIYPHDPHSTVMLVLANGGVIGAVAVLGLAATWCWALVRRVREDPAGAPVRLAYAVGTVGLFAFVFFMPFANRMGVVPALLAALAVAAPAVRRSEDAAPVDADSVDEPALVVDLDAPSTPWHLDPSARLALAGIVSLVGVMLSVGAVVGDIYIARAGVALNTVVPNAYVQANQAATLANYAQPARADAVFERLYVEGRGVVDGVVPLSTFTADVAHAPYSVTGSSVYLALLGQQALDRAMVASDSAAAAWGVKTVERAAKLTVNNPEVILEQAHAAIVDGRLADARRRLDQAAAIGANRKREALYEYYYARAAGDSATAIRKGNVVQYQLPELARLLAP